MTVRLRLSLPYPPSGNRYWRASRGRGMVPSHEALRYKATVAKLLAGQRPLWGDVVMSGVIYRPRPVGDLGNRLKVLEDALQGFAYLDDSQIAEYRRLRRSDDWPGEPRVMLHLTGERFATRAEAAQHAAAKASTAAKRRATLALRKKTGGRPPRRPPARPRAEEGATARLPQR